MLSPPELREALRRALAEWGVAAQALQSDSQSLIRSGALDSAALFNLSLWIETQIGQAIDPSHIDVLEAWDSVQAILAFVQATERDEPKLQHKQPTAPTAKPSPELPPYTLSQYRRGSPEDLAAIAQLYTHLWSPDTALNQQLFEWKYLRNPYALDPLIYLVHHQGRVVAMRALCETQWQHGTNAAPTTLYNVDDLIIDPAHRHPGLYAWLHAHAQHDLTQRGHNTYISLSALRVARLQSLAAGARSVTLGPALGRQSRRMRCADTLQRASSRIPLLWRCTQALAQHLAGRHAAARAFARLDASADIGRVRIRTEAPFTAMAELAQRAPQDTRWHQVRDETFMRWRYASPLHDYRFAYVEHNGALLAYAVLERSRSPSANAQRVNLVDWAARDAEALGEILTACINTARFAELVTWGDAHSALWQNTLQTHGFTPVDQAQTTRGLPCLLLHTVSNAPNDAPLSDNPADWHIRMIDTSYA